LEQHIASSYAVSSDMEDEKEQDEEFDWVEEEESYELSAEDADTTDVDTGAEPATIDEDLETIFKDDNDNEIASLPDQDQDIPSEKSALYDSLTVEEGEEANVAQDLEEAHMEEERLEQERLEEERVAQAQVEDARLEQEKMDA